MWYFPPNVWWLKVWLLKLKHELKHVLAVSEMLSLRVAFTEISERKMRSVIHLCCFLHFTKGITFFFYPWGTRDHLFQGKFNASHIWTQILSSWPSITFHYSILMKTRDFVNFAQSHWCECVCIKRKLQTFLKIKLLELCQHWHFTVSSILFFFFPINTLKFNVPEFDTIQINASESSTSGFNNNSNNFQYLFS